MLEKCEWKELECVGQLADSIRRRSFGDTITFSKNVFIPLVNLCRNKCAYCGFRKEPWDSDARLLRPEEVKSILLQGKKACCSEALFTFGEKPEEAYPSIRQELQRMGYSSIVEYLYDMCLEALKLGLLPHSNPGVLTEEEVKALKEVNASMGLMLENASKRLCGAGGPHEHSPGKQPKLRLKTIAYAGKWKVPFTTGLLIGIGETIGEVIASLKAIRSLHKKYGHIQEVIIQNFIPKKDTPMSFHPPPDFNYFSKIVALARVTLQEDISLQIPPNLNPGKITSLIKMGANDLGGISPITPDYINPSNPWPSIETIEKMVASVGATLRERLPVYPKYIKKGCFLSDTVAEVVASLSDKEGFRRRYP
ncbi:MAG: 7,8-didemethyl-8-hydroxy-5-deazariboflavin synthase CofG [Candidatus Jordarchaeales archaeon]